MADSTSRPLFSLSRILSLESGTGLAAEDDEDDELNQHWLSLIEDEEYLRILLVKDRDRNRIESHVDDWNQIGRSEAIQWIFNTRSSLRFQFRTAYLSVTYVDRFISKSHMTELKSDKPWRIRLLAVACLSLAAKAIDSRNWTLSSLLQTDGFMFTKNAIQRMELLVLATLDWRMHPITPFHFIGYLISCLCRESSSPRRLVSLISQIICATTVDLNLTRHRSSTIAMAATLMAMDQGLTRESMEIKLKTTWVNQLFDHVDVYTCYSQMQKLEPLKVNIFKPDLPENEENRSKRRRSS